MKGFEGGWVIFTATYQYDKMYILVYHFFQELVFQFLKLNEQMLFQDHLFAK